MLEGIKFDNLHSYLDFGLVLTSKTIGTPTPKIQVVDIPGADGEIDLTDYLGEVKYNNRPLAFEFQIIKNHGEFVTLFSDIQNALHGKRMKVILDIDEDFYYIGRVVINEWKSDKKIGKVYIDVDAEPFKYKKTETVCSGIIGETGKVIVNLRNLRKSATPTFRVSDIVNLTFGDLSTSVSAGTWTSTDILLTEGDNVVTFEGTPGTSIIVTYQEGGL